MTSDNRHEQDRGQVMDGWPMLLSATLVVVIVTGYITINMAVEMFSLSTPPAWLTGLAAVILAILVVLMLGLPLYGHNPGADDER